MESIVEFIDPPEDKRKKRSAEWKRIVQELRSNPGEWGKVGNFSPGVATAIRRGKYRAFLDGINETEDPEDYIKRCWKIRSAKTDDGSRNDIFVCWIGN